MEAAQSNLRAGDRLDRYELLCPIASGGMATVWLARLRGKRGFEKLFAIKTIRTELLEDPRFQEMLLDEARIASRIQHPNVAQILDLGEERDVLYIVMERVDGDSLARIRKMLSRLGAKMPVGIALRILADAAAGLHAAHELCDDHGQPLGIVHRDVSPQNILVSTTGAVKVIDFGIAKAQNRQQGETRTGVVKGKVQYMAPEQVKKGRTVDRRADVWALGVCLHELVTGRVPNDGDDHVEVIRKVLGDEPPQVAEGLPPPIQQILSKSLTLDPNGRYATADLMQRALVSAMAEMGENTTSNDIAAFIRAELPELEEKRREIIASAVNDARERYPSTARDQTPISAGDTPVSSPGQRGGPGGGEDVAFAPTVMRERSTASAAARSSEFPLTQRKPGRPSGPSHESAPISGSRAWHEYGPSFESSSSSSKEMDMALYEPENESIRIPKQSRAWLWILLLLLVGGGVGVAFYQPTILGRALALVGLQSLMPQTPSPASSTPSSALSTAPAQSAESLPSAATASAPGPSAASESGASRAIPPVLKGGPGALPHAAIAPHPPGPPFIAGLAAPDGGGAASALAPPPGVPSGRPPQGAPSPPPSSGAAAPTASAPPALPPPATPAPTVSAKTSPADESPNNPYNSP